jgi:hypothetical protein
MGKIVEQLQTLLDQGRDLYQESIKSSEVTVAELMRQSGSTLYQRMQKWVLDCRTVLKYAQLDDHARYFDDIRRLSSGGYVGVRDDRLAALESAISQIKGGFVGNIRHLLHADIFDSLIEQGTALLAEGHTIPAAVLGRIVIERWLRDQAEAAGIADHKTAKASKLNDDLKKAGKYPVPKWQQIQAHLAVGNSAAHGKSDEFSAEDVRQLLEYARAKCL